MAAAGHATDMQELAGAALLDQQTAQAVAAAIRAQGQQGMHAVQQVLQQQALCGLSPGQIKVVAAAMITQALWFAPEQQQHDSTAATAAAGSAAAPVALGVCASSNLSHQATPPAAAAAAEGCGGGAAAAAEAAAAADAAGDAEGAGGAAAGDDQFVAPKRKSVSLSNRTGKRRRPTSIAAPGPKQPGDAGGGAGGGGGDSTDVLAEPSPLQQLPPHTPAAPATGSGGTPGGMVTPAGTTPITADAVLSLLWAGTSTAPEMLAKLGGSTPQAAQQLQQVLEGLLSDGDQVCSTPPISRVDVTDSAVRFVAF
jgi:hypothetical protein